eukprot:TRINITY_DN95015_c0_g1_i1.p1 TRINITY_DN95015_c0_g1~~TRINITY_DN95015_c0_g1_i1.p1  ORF type:complete len:466 (+),score=69.96 TRINITY_DN95015_c0_g1_i1:42-1439(+)
MGVVDPTTEGPPDIGNLRDAIANAQHERATETVLAEQPFSGQRPAANSTTLPVQRPVAADTTVAHPGNSPPPPPKYTPSNHDVKLLEKMQRQDDEINALKQELQHLKLAANNQNNNLSQKPSPPASPEHHEPHIVAQYGPADQQPQQQHWLQRAEAPKVRHHRPPALPQPNYKKLNVQPFASPLLPVSPPPPQGSGQQLNNMLHNNHHQGQAVPVAHVQHHQPHIQHQPAVPIVACCSQQQHPSPLLSGSGGAVVAHQYQDPHQHQNAFGTFPVHSSSGGANNHNKYTTAGGAMFSCPSSPPPAFQSNHLSPSPVVVNTPGDFHHAYTDFAHQPTTGHISGMTGGANQQQGLVMPQSQSDPTAPWGHSSAHYGAGHSGPHQHHGQAPIASNNALQPTGLSGGMDMTNSAEMAASPCGGLKGFVTGKVKSGLGGVSGVVPVGVTDQVQAVQQRFGQLKAAAGRFRN